MTATVDGTETAGNADSATTSLPAPTLDSATGGAREVVVEWTIEDNNPDGEIDVERDGSEVETVTDLSQESYTDGGLDDGREYQYGLTRDTGDAIVSTDTDSAITDLPPVADLTVAAVDGRFVTLEATEQSNNSNGYRLLLREDDEGDHEQYGDDIDPVAEGETITIETPELLDGQLYGATVETFTDDTTAREDQ